MKFSYLKFLEQIAMSAKHNMPAHADKVNWQERLRRYLLLIRFHKPIGSFLLMWPALWALWIAGDGQPTGWIVAVFVLGVVIMRSAGCAINDYADRHVDGKVARTDQRPLATGLVSPKEALGVFAVLVIMAFCLVLLLNKTTIAMSIVAVVLAAIYPFMKRFTHLPQIFLGAAFGWAIPMAFTALTGSVPLVGWILFAATILWALIYDTEYAMVDREDDLKIGIKSSAILFGQYDRLIIGILQVLMFSLLVLVGLMIDAGLYYYLGLLVASGAAIKQQYQIRHRDPAECFKAFLANNYLGMIIFMGFVADYSFGG